MTRLATLISTIAIFTSTTNGDEATRLSFFETKIRPVLVENCYQCHSSSAKHVRGGLLLDSEAGVKAGGESGKLFVVGDPTDSLLISSLQHDSFEMPPDRRLAESVIHDFRKWIADGAIDPRKEGTVVERRQIDLNEGRKFWSFRPVVRPVVPLTDEETLSDIDRFLQASRIAERFETPPEVRSAQLIRRVYFALIGLPPTAEQIKDFAANWNSSGTDALESLVDELLSSERFGERWGRHWLDVVRYAESSGGGRSLMFPEAWRFRNYVVNSFNNDKRMDQFFREHIAGDLLPYDSYASHDDQLTGTGYLALGPTNYELQDKELLQMEVVDEQIDTMGRTFLGLTIGCARCHDHKFDPIPTSDYYALAGIFRSTQTLLPGNVSHYVTTSLKSGFNPGASTAWKTKVDALSVRIDQLKSKINRTEVSKFISMSSLAGIVVDDDDAVFEGNWTHSTIVGPFVHKGYRHDNFAKTGCRVRFETELAGGRYSVRICHNYQNTRCKRLPIVVHHADGATTVTIDQSKSPDDGVFAELGTFRFADTQKAVVTIDAEKSGPGVVIVDAIQFLPAELAVADRQADSRHEQRELKALERELGRLQKQKPETQQVMSVRDGKSVGDDHIRIRGVIRNKGDVVPRGFISVAGEFSDDGQPIPVSIDDNASGRLELADWIGSRNNPLTARVFVNRAWLHLLGEGLVRTPDNFGSMGQRPTHPELLDYLAATFVEEDEWSVKQLIRRIVLSKAFRMSSTGSSDSLQRDPDNRLLTRGFRRRVDAEFLRDSMLQISGQLTLTTPDRTITKVTQYDNGYDHTVRGQQYRSVYVPFFRNSMMELFLVYDVANANLVTGRRNTSTLPSQALYMLNSPEILHYSREAARQFLSERQGTRQDQQSDIEHLYLTCCGRQPTGEEMATISNFVVSSEQDEQSKWSAVIHSLFSSVDFRYID